MILSRKIHDQRQILSLILVVLVVHGCRAAFADTSGVPPRVQEELSAQAAADVVSKTDRTTNLSSRSSSNDDNEEDKSSSDSRQQQQQQQQQQQCGVYLAPSTIPGAGLGMFSGRYIAENQVVTPGDIVIPVGDYQMNNPQYPEYPSSEGGPLGDFFFNYYGWMCESYEGMMEDKTNNIAFAPGAGAALNCMIPLVNLKGRDDRLRMIGDGSDVPHENDRNADLHRSKDPGAGAFSPFYDRYTVAIREIMEGEELFDSYGDAYFAARENVYGEMPLSNDYAKADILLHKFINITTSMCEKREECEFMQDFYDYVEGENSISVAESPYLYGDFYHLLRNLSWLWPSRVSHVLPQDLEELDVMMDLGGTSFTNYSRSFRDIEWLKENGSCMDNLESKPSTVEQAGRGAFARRFIAKGQVVGPAPCIHISREEMNIHESFYNESGSFVVNATGPVVHQQLVLNYCFGHRHSSLLLCPYGMMVTLINHAPSESKVNAKIVWNYRMMQHPERMDTPHTEWIHSMSTGILFDYVATRDIQPGEEIFIDYGKEWEQAWKRHVENWKPPRDAESYYPAKVLNQVEVIRTVQEAGYPEHNVQLVCRANYRLLYGLRPDRDVEAIREWFGYIPNEGQYSKPCLARYRFTGRNGETLYTAELYSRTNDKEHQMCWEKLSEVMLVVPRDAFLFQDLKYTREYVLADLVFIHRASRQHLNLGLLLFLKSRTAVEFST